MKSSVSEQLATSMPGMKHFIVVLEVVLTNEQPLPPLLYELAEVFDARWTYLQSFIFRIARLSTNGAMTGKWIEQLDMLKNQGSVLDFAVKVIPQ